MRDPQLLAEAKKQKPELDPMDWRETTEAVDKIYASPPSVVKTATDITRGTGR